MTATVRVYTSADASAPTLTGQVGSLINLFDKCLVAGYGSATAAGWTKPYTGTNLAVFRTASGSIGGTMQPYLRLSDIAAQDTRLLGYETMSAVSTGTNPWPTNAQVSGGLALFKSDSADATARPWVMVACERAFHFFSMPSETVYGVAPTISANFSFGVFPSYKSGDAYNGFIRGSIATGNYTISYELGTLATAFAAITGAYGPRAYTQTGTAIRHNWVSAGGTATTDFASGPFIYPDPITGGFRLTRILIRESDNSGANTAERGYLPGVWNPLHNSPANFFDTFTGSADLAGKSFIVLPVTSGSSARKAVIETTGNWGL